MASGPSELAVSEGSPDTAKAMRAQRASFLLDALQECMRMVAAIHTMRGNLGKNGVLRPALAWGCFLWQRCGAAVPTIPAYCLPAAVHTILIFYRGKRLQCFGHCEDKITSRGTLSRSGTYKILLVGKASVCSLDLSIATAVYNANPPHAMSYPLCLGKLFDAMATEHCNRVLFEGG
jgi:hypothetical protein